MVIASQDVDAYQRYSVMRVGALRALCKEKGLPSDGRKEDLVNRLCHNCSNIPSGLINASNQPSSNLSQDAAAFLTDGHSSKGAHTDGANSDGGVSTPLGPSSTASSSLKGEGDSSSGSNRLTAKELRELASIADEIRHIRKQTEFTLLRAVGLITDYPTTSSSSCHATSDIRYGMAQKTTPYGYPLAAPTSRAAASLHQQQQGYWAYERQLGLGTH